MSLRIRKNGVENDADGYPRAIDWKASHAHQSCTGNYLGRPQLSRTKKMTSKSIVVPLTPSLNGKAKGVSSRKRSRVGRIWRPSRQPIMLLVAVFPEESWDRQKYC